MMRYTGLLLLLVPFLAACNLGTTAPQTTTIEITQAPANSEKLVVAWALQGDLTVWQTGDSVPRRVASAGAIQPYISPDGQRVAFTRGPQGQPETLWVVSVDGSGEQQLVGENPADYIPGSNQIGDVVWIDGRTILYNTLTRDDLIPIPENDLYGVDVITRAITRIASPGDGGRISVSPDGSNIVTVYHGNYGQQDGAIRTHNIADSGNPTTLITFNGVSTASEFRFYPEIFWEDNETILFAIPDPDLVYGDLNEEELPPTVLWRVPVSNPSQREQTGSVNASFFGMPQWSHDASAMIYSRRDASANTVQALLANGDGSNPREIFTGEITMFGEHQWLPSANQFIYSDISSSGTRQFFLSGLDLQAQILKDSLIYAIQFVTDDQYIYLTDGEGRIEVRSGTLGGESQFIGSVPALPVFDAVYVN